MVIFVASESLSMYHLHPMAEQTKLLERAILSSNVQITKRQDQDSMAATNDSIAFSLIMPVAQFHIDTPLSNLTL
jgi:hypothetical protein